MAYAVSVNRIKGSKLHRETHVKTAALHCSGNHHIYGISMMEAEDHKGGAAWFSCVVDVTVPLCHHGKGISTIKFC